MAAEWPDDGVGYVSEVPSFKFKELLPVVVYIICYNSHVSSDDSSGEGKLVNLGSGPHNHKLGPS